MVKMDLPASQGQGDSASSRAESRISAYQSAISALMGYASADALKGLAYTASKAYGTQVLVPIYQGLILLSEGVSQSTKELPAQYEAQVASESLDSDVLITDIDGLTMSIDNSYRLLSMERSKKKPNQGTISQIRSSIAKEEAYRTELQDKLEKLLTFNTHSPSYFSAIPDLVSAVDAGLSAAGQVNSSFKLPSDMSWAKVINTSWKAYQKEISKAYQDVLDKVNRGEALTEKDVKVLSTYLEYHPDAMTILETNPKLKRALTSYVNNQIIEKVDEFKENDWVQRFTILYKIYPKKFVEAILKNDIVVDAINASKHREKIYSALAAYEKFGKASGLNKVGKYIDDFFKYSGLASGKTRLKSLVGLIKDTSAYKALSKSAWLGKGMTFLGKAGTVLTYTNIAISGVGGGLNEYAKTGHVGKAIVGGSLDAIKTIGPLEGATIGASAGSLFGTAIPIPIVGTVSGAALGGALGLALGTANTVAQLINPNLYSDVKSFVYKGIDWFDKTTEDMARVASEKIEKVGKAINKGVDTIKKGAHVLGEIGKAIKVPGFGW